MDIRYVDRWDRNTSDGCSVPWFLRPFVAAEPAAAREVCKDHDERYYYGGSRSDRRTADAKLYEGLVAAGMSRVRAAAYWAGVRAGGGPRLRVERVSWAFGESFFSYSEEPARPRPEN